MGKQTTMYFIHLKFNAALIFDNFLQNVYISLCNKSISIIILSVLKAGYTAEES